MYTERNKPGKQEYQNTFSFWMGILLVVGVLVICRKLRFYSDEVGRCGISFPTMFGSLCATQ